jgi:hypothetical protein
MNQNATRTDKALRVVATAAVALVSGIAGAVSFEHIVSLATKYGQPYLAAHLLPGSIDGAIMAASLVMLADARASRRVSPLARLMLGGGIAATIGCNALFGLGHGVLGAVIAGIPALAMVGGIELLTGMVGRSEVAEVARDAETVALSPSVARVAVARVAPVASDAMAAALDLLASEPTLTGADLGRRLNVSPRSGQRIMRRLAAQGA